MLAFLDDIVIGGHDWGTHLKRLDLVLGRLQLAGLKLKVSKVEIAKPQMRVLGFLVDQNGLHPDLLKTRAIAVWPLPTTQKQLLSAMQTFNFLRKFVPNYASLAKPLYALTSKNTQFEWTDEQQKSVVLLKQHL